MTFSRTAGKNDRGDWARQIDYFIGMLLDLFWVVRTSGNVVACFVSGLLIVGNPYPHTSTFVRFDCWMKLH